MSNKLSYLQGVLAEKELKAKIRDTNQELDLATIKREVDKASSKGVKIVVTENKHKAEFIQSIKDNISILVKSKYLTIPERGFIFSLTPLVEMHSNAIVDEETGQFLTVSEIAKYLERDLSGTSKMINGLIDKGVIYEFVNVNEIKNFKRSVTKRPLFFNPEIIYCGDKNKINATLCRLVINSDKLEKKKIFLNWKLWLRPNEQYGTLYKRKTYLKLKKQN